jgi:hypothetical protein
LQLTDIMPAQRKIMGKISSASAMRFMKLQRPFEKRTLQLKHFRVKPRQFPQRAAQERIYQGFHGG